MNGYTAASSDSYSATFVCEKRPRREYWRDLLRWRLARGLFDVQERFCGAFGHFIWMHDEDDPEHPFACWPIGGPGARGPLGWAVRNGLVRDRPPRYHFRQIQ